MKWLFKILFSCLLALAVLSGQGYCAKQIVIKPTAQLPQVVVRENFIQLAEAKIESALTEAGENRRHSIEPITVPAGLRLPAGDITYEASIPNGVRFAKGMQVNIDVSIDGKHYTQVRCTMRVRVFDNMVVAARQFRQEKTITAEDVRLEEREDSGANWTYYTDVNQVIGKVAKKVVTQGTIINSSIIQNPIAVSRGDKIKITAEVNGVVIQTDGVAMENGRIDGYITVKNINSSRLLRGKVVDENHVLVS